MSCHSTSVTALNACTTAECHVTLPVSLHRTLAQLQNMPLYQCHFTEHLPNCKMSCHSTSVTALNTCTIAESKVTLPVSLHWTLAQLQNMSLYQYHFTEHLHSCRMSCHSTSVTALNTCTTAEYVSLPVSRHWTLSCTWGTAFQILGPSVGQR
jgi:hypothetical protein